MRSQAAGMVRVLRRDEVDPARWPRKSIERRRALAGEQLARSMAHQFVMVVDRTQVRHEPVGQADTSGCGSPLRQSGSLFAECARRGLA